MPSAAEVNEQLIHTFYTSFQVKDAERMASLYDPEVEFSDPVFTNLKGAQVGSMWRMLVSAGTDLRIAYRDVKANDTRGSCIWEAWYTFRATGRPVHNRIQADFEFRNGKIIRHTDRFGFWRWTRMALGPLGFWLGWSPLVIGRIRRKARKSLQHFTTVQENR